MIKKLDDYLSVLKRLIAAGRPLTPAQLESVRAHIGFFQHERLAHELVMLVFALLIPYIKHYYNLENGVQQLYVVYDELERLGEGK